MLICFKEEYNIKISNYFSPHEYLDNGLFDIKCNSDIKEKLKKYNIQHIVYHFSEHYVYNFLNLYYCFCSDQNYIVIILNHLPIMDFVPVPKFLTSDPIIFIKNTYSDNSCMYKLYESLYTLPNMHLFLSIKPSDMLVYQAYREKKFNETDLMQQLNTITQQYDKYMHINPGFIDFLTSILSKMDASTEYFMCNYYSTISYNSTNEYVNLLHQYIEDSDISYRLINNKQRDNFYEYLKEFFNHRFSGDHYTSRFNDYDLERKNIKIIEKTQIQCFSDCVHCTSCSKYIGGLVVNKEIITLLLHRLLHKFTDLSAMSMKMREMQQDMEIITHDFINIKKLQKLNNDLQEKEKLIEELRILKQHYVLGFDRVEIHKKYPNVNTFRQWFYSSVEWADTRIKILIRDNYTCKLCGTSPAKEVHHYNDPYFVPESALNPENLLTLCKHCHNRWHDRINVNAIELKK